MTVSENGTVTALEHLELSASTRKLIAGVAMNTTEVVQRLAGFVDGMGSDPDQQWALVIDGAHLEHAG